MANKILKPHLIGIAVFVIVLAFVVVMKFAAHKAVRIPPFGSAVQSAPLDAPSHVLEDSRNGRERLTLSSELPGNPEGYGDQHDYTLHGIVSLITSVGNVENGNGQMSVSVLHQRQWYSQAVPINKGKWEVTVGPLDVQSLRVSDLTVEGRSAYACAPGGVYNITTDAPIHVTAKWYSRTSLRAVDADTHALIPSLSISRAADLGALWESLPDQKFIELGSHLTSPVDLEGEVGIVTYHVAADGYSTKTVVIDHGVGGERVVALTRSGVLLVSVDNHNTHPEAVIRVAPTLESAEQQVLTTLVSECGPQWEVQVPLGSYSVTLACPHSKTCTGGSVSKMVTVSVGARAVLTLDCHSSALCDDRGACAKLYGTIGMQSGSADLSDFRIAITPTDNNGWSGVSWTVPLSAEPSGSATARPVFSWTGGEVSLGTYLLSIESLGFHALVDVVSEGDCRMDLLVPERHSILVRFHESGDDAAVTVQRVRWIATDAEGRPYGKLYPSRAASGQIAYELDSRSSRILLNITDPVYALVERDHVYDLAGTQSINVEVMRSARIVLSCVSNSMIVPMNAEWWDRVCVVDSAGNDRTIGREMVSEDRECVLQVMGGGTFGLRCAEVVGFDVRGPSLVECSVGNVMRYEIELSPK